MTLQVSPNSSKPQFLRCLRADPGSITKTQQCHKKEPKIDIKILKFTSKKRHQNINIYMQNIEFGHFELKIRHQNSTKWSIFQRRFHANME